MSSFQPPQYWIAGVDEVGRGALIGHVVAAAVVLNPNWPVACLRDSKQLSAKVRQALYLKLVKQAQCWAIGMASPEEIDRYNIHYCTLLAMQRAVEKITVPLTEIWVDGAYALPTLPQSKAFIQGDRRLSVISAASILAKETRDAQMLALHRQYPEYGLDQNKGYPTASHLSALAQYGPTVHHRFSFKPLSQLAPVATRAIYDL